MGIGNLKVLLTKENNVWVALGIDIDYAAQSDTIDGARAAFIAGFEADIAIKTSSKEEKFFLKPSPTYVWNMLWDIFPSYKVYNYLIPDHTKNIIQFDYLTFISPVQEPDTENLILKRSYVPNNGSETVTINNVVKI